MKLAGLAVQSVLLGLYASLVVAMSYLLLNAKGAERRKNRALLAGLVLLSAMITGYWICIVIRAFEAFVIWRGGLQASVFYEDSTGPSSVAREAFHKATIIVSDAFVISRLHAVWNRSKIIAAGPVLSLIGTIVSSIGATYAFGAYDTSNPSSVAALSQWHIAQTSFTLSINIYCTSLTFWRIWRTHRETAK
ncbi:uncharacterized protein SCHCODRAFT_01192011 [Schizophyllum commune H4-8]|nr:uncharacterized protein SCHCODRAFT_01192011 [Schizophyllum commune H4-8]KAI5888138.1 hypothetical protein SCHCODRAFT_01192011 [Schizophyllum commune H4-8]